MTIINAYKSKERARKEIRDSLQDATVLEMYNVYWLLEAQMVEINMLINEKLADVK